MIFLFATELEAQPFRKLCPDAMVEICGVGAAECAASTAAIIAQMQCSGESHLLVLAGIAGSYSLHDVALCEVVEVVESQIYALPSKFAVAYKSEPQTSLRAVSLNTVNSSCFGEVAAQIEDMEGAAFAAVCQKMGVNSLQIRAISNKVGDPFDQWKIEQALNALAEALKKVSVDLSDAIFK